MTAAVTVEVGTVGHSEPRAGTGVHWNGAAAAGEGSSVAPAAQSFRSNWQAQLASLGSEADTPVAASESAKPMGAEFKDLDRSKLAGDAVSSRFIPGMPVVDLPASQILPARVGSGETFGR